MTHRQTPFILLCSVLLLSTGCSESHLDILYKLEMYSHANNVVTANTNFGFKLFNEIRKTQQDKNLFISPISISIALAMMLNGAVGETEQAMAKALQLQDMDSASINTGYTHVRYALQPPGSEGALIIANSIWANQRVPFKQDFLQRNTQFYGAEISNLDFNDPSALETINQWVNTSTNGKIPKILDGIRPETVLFLINTIYFKAAWTRTFNPQSTHDRSFHLITGDKKQVPMMATAGWNSSYPYYRGNTFQAVSLPYHDGQMSMYIFLPDPESDLNTFLEHLNAERWESWMSQFHQQRVRLVLPKFKFEYRVRLNNALRALGMGIALSAEANFSRMALPHPMGLFINEVIHSTVIDVHEGGTEAAAATVVGTLLGAPRVEIVPFIADRPFFFAIRDNTTKTVLFMGTVMEP